MDYAITDAIGVLGITVTCVGAVLTMALFWATVALYSIRDELAALRDEREPK